jgi:predicted homoserine dehydrogenase-like protein
MTYKPSDPTSPIRIGIIGVGSMGKGLLYQSHITPGIDCVAVCDISIDRCVDALKLCELRYKIVANQADLGDTIKKGLIGVCEDGMLLAESEYIDAIIEASSSIIPAGQFALKALAQGKHLVLMNSEIDLIFGPLFSQAAKKNGVIFTSCDGDQYGVLKHLIVEIKSWGFDLVMAGNIKGFLDRYANPTTIIPEAEKRNLDYKMCTAYTDGTKLNIEMALIANAFNLQTTIAGMQGPKAKDVHEALHLFDFDTQWNNKKPLVDYILGAEPGGGVFVIGHCDNPYQRGMLSYYKMGEGPYYVFYRPYHLCHIEAIANIIQSISAYQPFMQPNFGFQTNVYAYAKRDLHRGDQLDGIGGYSCYGLIENCTDNFLSPGLPICLADHVTVKHDVAKDNKIFMSDVVYDPQRLDFTLYRKALEEANQRVV